MWVTIGAIPRDASVVTHSLTIGEKCFLRSHTVIYAGSVIGNLFETGHGAIVRERVAIGNRVLLGSHSEIEPDTIIGDDVRIHSSCFVAEGSVLERGVRLYPGARLASDKHPWMENRLKKRKGPTLREGARICMSATILPNVVVGAYAVVGAGSVVVRDVLPYTVVAGNPARIIRKLR